MYALNLGENNRILSATYAKFAVPGQPIVDTIPKGNINDYRFVNGGYIYDPLPVPPEPTPEPSAEEILNALLGVE